MRPFFYKSHCHHAFFALGEWLVANMEREELASGISYWLSIVTRLVSASSITQQGRTRMEQRSIVENFEWKTLLGVTHNDALQTLIELFKSSIQKGEAGSESGTKMVEKVLASLQSLVRGMIQLNEYEKKADAEPGLDPDLLNEIDSDKIMTLVDMGFSQVCASVLVVLGHDL